MNHSFRISIHALREEGDVGQHTEGGGRFLFLSTPSARRATGSLAFFQAGDVDFYPRPPRGGRQSDSEDFTVTQTISIHALREEGDFTSVRLFWAISRNFYPRPPRGGRRFVMASLSDAAVFLSTPSARRATVQRRVDSSAGGNFYPRPPRGGRPGPRRSRPGKSSNFYPRPPRGGRLRDAVRGLSGQMISIHALREEGDRAVCDKLTQLADISIHALREEGDLIFSSSTGMRWAFLSTPSARRATADHVLNQMQGKISIHALREEGDHSLFASQSFLDISIHALREEGDKAFPHSPKPTAEFLSTPSARRATCGRGFRCIPCINFYPRPPRGGRPITYKRTSPPRNFYPRPPRGGRPEIFPHSLGIHIFLSTPSARRATLAGEGEGGVDDISIHALREEGDGLPLKLLTLDFNFYPRPPRGGRRWRLFGSQHKYPISIHALREEGDYSADPSSTDSSNFYPRPPRGGRRGAVDVDDALTFISIHALREEGDPLRTSAARLPANFYPRPPRGGRLADGLTASMPQIISIHALREEGDERRTRLLNPGKYFYPRPPRGGRPLPFFDLANGDDISIHALREEGDSVVAV